jgi:DNA-binding Lrp family transcriptional regulator
MVVAYVMIKAATGDVEPMREAMAAIEGVTSTHVVAGDVDFVVKVDVDSPAAVHEVVGDGLAAVDGVESTQTYIAMG